MLPPCFFFASQPTKNIPKTKLLQKIVVSAFMEDSVTLDEDLVKTATGQYDVSLPYALILPHIKLRQLDASVLSRCTNLLQIDFSHNELTSVVALQGCISLRRLNVAYNRISGDDLNTLCELKHLEVLLLQGNNISSVECLAALQKGCLVLRALYLQEYDRSGQNPVCATNDDYGTSIMKCLPQLRALDGNYFGKEELKPKRVAGVDDSEMVLPESKEWIGPQFFPIPYAHAQNQKLAQPGQAAERQLADMLTKCRQCLSEVP